MRNCLVHDHNVDELFQILKYRLICLRSHKKLISAVARLVSIDEVAVRWARLILGWVTVLTLPYLTFRGGCTRHTGAQASIWAQCATPTDLTVENLDNLEAFANLRRTVQWIPLRVSSESV